MLQRRVSQDSPTTSRDLRYSGRISSTPRRLATEELANYLSDFGLGDGRVHLRVPSLCFLTGRQVGGIEEILEVFLPPSDNVLQLRNKRINESDEDEQLKSLQSGFKHVNDGGFQLQSNHLTMDLDNNININMPPIETKVLIIQRAWRDFLQRQEVEKRSPSPPSLSSSDKMSMSISMTTLSDGSTPYRDPSIHLLLLIRDRVAEGSSESLSRDAQTSLTPQTSSSSSGGGSLRRFHTSRET
ncbi:hypothetical protein L3Q82_004955 [Scortum barcoo]|uniref:Uncharacterized protein n=1 Tax=Scortum barcoo TaxID=214431 RepID=A0ACB8VFP4_9TELE|nr:hypothetical protein L3Q82_004955 [Scortum barcoo]